MEEKIKAALKKAGLSEDLWTKVKVTKEEEIDGALNTLKEMIPESLDKFLELPENSKLKEEFELNVQKLGDQRVTQGIETFKKKNNLTDDMLKKLEKPEDDEAEKKKVESMNANEKAIHELTKTVGTLADTVKNIQTTSTTESKNTQAKALLIKEELAEGDIKYIDINSETPLSEQITELKERINGVKQKAVNDAIEEGGTLKVSEKDMEASTKSAIDSYAEEQERKGKTPVQEI